MTRPPPKDNGSIMWSCPTTLSRPAQSSRASSSPKVRSLHFGPSAGVGVKSSSCLHISFKAGEVRKLAVDSLALSIDPRTKDIDRLKIVKQASGRFVRGSGECHSVARQVFKDANFLVIESELSLRIRRHGNFNIQQ